MRAFTATITALGLTMVAAVPAATGDAACATIPPPSTSSCITTILTVLATGAATNAPLQTPAPAATAGSASRNNGTASSGAPAASNNTGSSTTNVQKFTGALGGPPPPVISSAGERPFSVNGDTFVGASAAIGRSCDIQHNACADAANSGKISASVSQCDQQNTACHSANNLKKRLSLEERRPATSFSERAALDLGSCSDASIVFGEGIDGRNTAAFVPANQQDFNHGSALNIAVIAGFICQQLDSPCRAPSDTQASCAQASSAAVAAPQNQTAADTWNAIMGNGVAGGAAAAAASAQPAAAITPAPSLAAIPSPAVQLLTFSSCS